MQNYEECFRSVKKDCFKFISSQETPNEKFKNKQKMIEKFLVPVCFWISKKIRKNNTTLVGLSGGQGTGKTTTSSLIEIILKKYFKLKVFKISIDDFYKTRKERISLSKKVHPLLKTRGVPGTHDIDLMINFFKQVKKKKFKTIFLPKFEKSIDDRVIKKKWYKLKKKPDVIIFEGWCVGAKSQKNKDLNKSINQLERNHDQSLKWRKYVNKQLLNKYKKFHSMLDHLIYLKAESFEILRKWRLKQEKKLSINIKNKKNLKIMSKQEVLTFMMTYQRITENMFKYASKYASVLMTLNDKHQIKKIKYLK